MKSGKNGAEELVTDKIVNVHTIAIVIVCIIFGIINLVSGKALSGILITVFGFISAIVSLGLKGRISRTKRGFILSQLQLIIIIVAASANNTTALITRSIEAVDKGIKLAYNVADKMKGAIEISRESAEYAHRITVIANEQTEYVSAASGKMGNITRVVNQSRF